MTDDDDDDDDGKRKPLRFAPDANTVVWLSENLDKVLFKDDKVGLAVNESHKGFNLITVGKEKLYVGKEYLVKIGLIGPLLSELRWINEVDQNIYRCGFYLKE